MKIKLNLTIENVRKSDLNAIEMCIKSVSFYQRKAKYLKEIADQIDDVPSNYEDLIKLPGIGMKMAKLILKIAYN